MLTLLFSTLLTIGSDTLPPDGPYLFYGAGDTVVARWADTGAGTAGSVVFQGAETTGLPVFATFEPGRVDPQRSFDRRTMRTYENVSHIAALSDVHGQFETTRKLLETNGIIDADMQWTFGTGHLVIVGDVFDRGDQVTEILWLIHNLEAEAEAAGGRVHFLLGNHETMVLEGDERYLNPRYRTTSGLLGEFYGDLYGPDTYLGRWLRSLPLAVNIDGVVFVHGGISRAMAREVGSLDRMNELYHDYLIDADDIRDVKRDHSRLSMLHGSGGPLWYRGYFSKANFDAHDLNYVLRKLDAERIVVGHTSFTAVQGFYDNRLIAVDSSIKFGSVGELLLIENGAYFRGTIDGRRLPLVATKK
ncbi:metallophosphoesterase [Lewinella sp. IMCC34183]|uniref:metallophosphoesterase n=1 Tax=Lewinella sp. IMCC34183 TaxID=2248762 RepID=UPI000E276FBC|nr:metallophosphoesterase [Lewinella sp. IMCC34183]